MSVSLYQFLKLLHILGAVIFVGNITVTAVWKVLADRSGDPRVVAFSQRVVTVTDFALTGTGATLVLISGLVMSASFEQPFWHIQWLAWGLGLFTISGIIWAAILIPIQIRQARLASTFRFDHAIPESYRRLSRIWILFGALATLLPLINLYFMVFKPV